MKDTIHIDKAAYGQKAANIIRQRIIEGVYAQGQRLIEENLAEEYDISRGCIRDAFLILESEGMVKSERNKYTKVLKLNQKDIADLFRFRLILELFSIENCIEKNCIPAEKLNRCMEAMDIAMDVNKINSFKYVEQDLNFHEALIQSTNNDYVINIYKSIKYQIMTLLYFLYSMFKEEFSVQGRGQHHQIAEFLKNNDVGNSQKFIREHIENNLDFVIKLNKKAELL
jgi:DNA-binding GntR family transcriptional regulator